MSTPPTPASRKAPPKPSVFDFHINTSEKAGVNHDDIPELEEDQEDHGAGGSAEGWATLSKTMTEYDEVKIKDCKEDMDTLLVFAGLFSAVLTAFVIELYRALQPDPTQMAYLLLTQMSQQLNSFTVSSGFVNSTHPLTISPPTFSPSISSVRINILWFCSLVCSLVTASVAMLIKQWLREYQSQENISPRSRSRIRYWRNRGLTQFRVLELAAFLPLLLQLALMLFFGGLCLFLQDLHRTVGWVVTAFVMVWFMLYVSTTLAPAFSSRCPYKTPLLKEPLQSVQRRFHQWRKRDAFPSSRVEARDERLLRTDQALDIPALVAADATLQDDEFLDKTIRKCLAESEGGDVSVCVAHIISNRSGTVVPSLAEIHVSELQKLSNIARSAIVRILLDALDRELEENEQARRKTTWLPWMRGSLICIGSALMPLYPSSVNVKVGGQVYDHARAGAMVTKLLSSNEDVARGTLEVLAFSKYQRLPSSFAVPPITTSKVITNIIAGTDACLAAKTVDATQLCQVVLYLATHFDDEGLREDWYRLHKMLSVLATAITEAQALVPDYPHLARHAAQQCLDSSTKLNLKHRGTVGTDLTDVLVHLMGLQEFQVVGRHLPTENEPTPKIYRMRIFAPNEVVAKSRFWYFLRQLKKVKKASGEIIGVNVVSIMLLSLAAVQVAGGMGANLAFVPSHIHEKKPLKVKNFGIWLRYDSRSGTHNMYKEFRELSRSDAVKSLYQDMAARHRARFRSIHILRVVEIEKSEDVRRPYIKQLLVPKLKFPLPHRVVKTRSTFVAHRPATF
ncbi:60S ribosomal protein L20 [Steccherinum ochraceum]|uniref:60S ribosomal protein L20 n=1 Tax=Steccherinum ochraceum TaxID=92696 RepID=A0A4R0RMJ1_9APHY|nr:60S ribosomal protein L20 [Steccherinum ochraceum]